jgi:hypothetical protein
LNQRPEQGVPSQLLVDRDWISVEVEQSTATFDGRRKIAQISQPQDAFHLPGDRRCQADLAMTAC